MTDQLAVSSASRSCNTGPPCHLPPVRTPIVRGMRNRSTNDAPRRGASGPGRPWRFAGADVVARLETARVVARANDTKSVHPRLGIGDDIEASAHCALPIL